MSTQAEKTADPATLVDDIVSVATSVSGWSQVDSSYVTNDGSNTDWNNNGAVLHDSNSGVYVTMYLSSNKNSYGHDSGGDYDMAALRMCHSTEYDANNHRPSGLTDSHEDPFTEDLDADRGSSFSDVHTENDEGATCLHMYDEDAVSDLQEWRNTQLSYFISAGSGWISVAGWSEDGTGSGSAAFYSFEHTDNKIWEDGNAPYIVFTGTRGTDADETVGDMQYGFNWYSHNRSLPLSLAYGGDSGVDSPSWGYINPELDDDTFIFKPPAFYLNPSRNVPVGYVKNIIPNHSDRGMNHGGTTTADGITYKAFRKSGGAGSEGKETAVALRFE